LKNIIIDSSVLIDVLTGDPRWFDRSSAALKAAIDETRVVINPIIFAEISATFQKIEDLDERMPADLYRRDPIPYGAAFLAARAFLKYRRRGGSRTSPMPDFYIGAHAEFTNSRVLTRDPRRIRMYFPTVEIIAP
jgi:predicted nucleic acid-binding protein